MAAASLEARLRAQAAKLKPTSTHVSSVTSLFGAGGDEELETDEFASRSEQLRELVFLAQHHRSGSTLQCRGPAAAGRLVRAAVLIYTGKAPQCSKFDTFAYQLCGSAAAESATAADGVGFALQQLDAADLAAGRLTAEHYDVLLVPGGPICDVEAAVGDAGSQAVLAFVAAGGGYFGACAGAFLAARDGYHGCRRDFAMLPAATSWLPGIGVATVEVLPSAVFAADCPLVGARLRLHWANGSCHAADARQPVVPVCRFVDVATDKSDSAASAQRIADYPYAAVAANYGSGRVIAFGPHPEASGDTGSQLLRHALLWAAKIL